MAVNGPHVTAEERPLRKDAARNRELLLCAAAQVFAEQGLAASVEEVARVAGVGMGTLYRRFPTKQDLVAELVRAVFTRFRDLAADARDAPDGTGLEQFLRSASGLLAANRGCLPRLWSTPDERELLLESRGHVAALLHAAQQHGEMREDLVLTDITVLLWSLRGVIETTHRASPPPWQRHLELLLAGLRPSPHELTSPPVAQDVIDDLLRNG